MNQREVVLVFRSGCQRDSQFLLLCFRLCAFAELGQAWGVVLVELPGGGCQGRCYGDEECCDEPVHFFRCILTLDDCEIKFCIL